MHTINRPVYCTVCTVIIFNNTFTNLHPKVSTYDIGLTTWHRMYLLMKHCNQILSLFCCCNSF